MPRVKPEETPSPRRIPTRRVRAAAIAAGVVAAILGAAALLAPLGDPRLDRLEASEVLLMIGGVSGGLFLLILFALSIMQAGHEWNRRGGHPDPFTRD